MYIFHQFAYVYHDGFIFCSYFHLFSDFDVLLFQRLLIYITSDGLFSSFDVADLLKVYPDP